MTTALLRSLLREAGIRLLIEYHSYPSCSSRRSIYPARRQADFFV